MKTDELVKMSCYSESWKKLKQPLCRPILKTLKKLKFKRMTPVQVIARHFCKIVRVLYYRPQHCHASMFHSKTRTSIQLGNYFRLLDGIEGQVGQWRCREGGEGWSNEGGSRQTSLLYCSATRVRRVHKFVACTF